MHRFACTALESVTLSSGRSVQPGERSEMPEKEWTAHEDRLVDAGQIVSLTAEDEHADRGRARDRPRRADKARAGRVAQRTPQPPVEKADNDKKESAA
jgi:hypothetical protein